MIDTKNALISVARIEKSADATTKVRGPWAIDGEAVSAYVYLQHKSAAEVYKQFMLELRNPAAILCDLADADTFDPGLAEEGQLVEVSFNGWVYHVAARPMRYESGEDSDHASVVLEAVRFPHS